jgi:hypothetical protein
MKTKPSATKHFWPVFVLNSRPNPNSPGILYHAKRVLFGCQRAGKHPRAAVPLQSHEHWANTDCQHVLFYRV